MKTSKPENKKTVKAVYNVNPRTIEINSNGAKVTCPHHQTGETPAFGLEGKKAGSVIKGFSKHSSKRMREAFWGIVPRDGVDLFSVTLTVPGEVPLTPPEERKLWDRFVILLSRALPSSGGWRREHQLRGQVHWHLILAALEDVYLVEWKLRGVWLQALRSLPDSFQAVDKKKSAAWRLVHGLDVPEGWTYRGSRAGMLGADLYACKVEIVDNKTGIYKYLMDHASKHKREQESTFGRAWGFIRKKDMPVFFDAPVSRSAELSEYQFARLHRILRKWCRPRVKCPAAPFGYKLGWETKRGRLGSSIWFGMPEKAVEWACELVKPESPAVPVFRPSDFPARTRCLI